MVTLALKTLASSATDVSYSRTMQATAQEVRKFRELLIVTAQEGTDETLIQLAAIINHSAGTTDDWWQP